MAFPAPSVGAIDPSTDRAGNVVFDKFVLTRDKFELILHIAYAGKRKFFCCQKQIVVKQAQIYISTNRGDISTNRCGPVCAALYLGS